MSQAAGRDAVVTPWLHTKNKHPYGNDAKEEYKQRAEGVSPVSKMASRSQASTVLLDRVTCCLPTFTTGR